MNPITLLLSIIDVFQIETLTVPTMADVADRLTLGDNAGVSRDLGWWLSHLVKMGYLYEHMLSYAITAEGLTALERATGVSQLVSGSMVIGIDPADEAELHAAFKALIAASATDEVIKNDPRIMSGSQFRTPVYFSGWYPAEIAAGFRK